MNSIIWFGRIKISNESVNILKEKSDCLQTKRLTKIEAALDFRCKCCLSHELKSEDRADWGRETESTLLKRDSSAFCFIFTVYSVSGGSGNVPWGVYISKWNEREKELHMNADMNWNAEYRYQSTNTDVKWTRSKRQAALPYLLTKQGRMQLGAGDRKKRARKRKKETQNAKPWICDQLKTASEISSLLHRFSSTVLEEQDKQGTSL